VQSMKDLRVGSPNNLADACIDACTMAELACLACAESCLADAALERTRLCIRLSLDCAEACWTTRSLVAEAFVLAPRLVQSQLDNCALVCAACAAECRRQGDDTELFASCARACFYCERQCRDTQTRSANLH
jgi:hypothetical protein